MDTDKEKMNPEREEKTSLKKRIIAGIFALLVIGLSIMYAYSIATGAIFAW